VQCHDYIRGWDTDAIQDSTVLEVRKETGNGTQSDRSRGTAVLSQTGYSGQDVVLRVYQTVR